MENALKQLAVDGVITVALGGAYTVGKITYKSAAKAYQAAKEAGLLRGVTRGGIDPNKLHHIFGKSDHNLEGLVKQFDSREKAFNALQEAAQTAVKSQGIKSLFETTVKVGNETITVRGNVVGGVVRISIAFK